MNLQGQKRFAELGVVLKGVSRRVVVVTPKEQDAFEQAIFVVKDVPLSQKELLRQACKISQQYLEREEKTATGRWTMPFACFVTGLCIGAASAILLFTLI